MQGVITSRDVFRQTFTIIHLWGPAFYARCLLACARHRPRTFLELLCADERAHRQARHE
jgi:hypothetical protein